MDILRSTKGVSLTASAVSTSAALPLDARSKASAVIRVCAIDSASVHVRVGDSNVTATTSDLLITNGREVAIDASGKTHIAVIQSSVGSGGLVNVVPYE